MTLTKKCLVTIPAFGSNALTHAVLPDVMAESDLVDLLIVDNGGHYEKVADEWVITPDQNLGWAGASNLGFRTAFRRGYEFALTLNNDTRLSPHFFAGLLDSRLPDDVGLVAPAYDGYWTVQSSNYRGAVDEYEPSDYFRRVPIIDGTALMMSAKAWEVIGGLDERTFGKFGWGADIDLAIRAATAGFGVYVTERSFVHHMDKVSACETFGKLRYLFQANLDCQRALRRLYGRKVVRAIRRAGAERMPFESRGLSVGVT